MEDICNLVFDDEVDTLHLVFILIYPKMQSKKSPGELLQMLSYTSQEVADFAGVTPVMIRKIKNGDNNGSPEVQAKILAYIRQKIATVQASLPE